MGKPITYILLMVLLFSTASAQSVSLSITNQNKALVEETRDITIEKATSTINIPDLPALLDPTSIHVDFQPPSIKLLEQKFVYNPANSHNILMKSIGTKIRLLHPDLGTVQGTLISVQGSTIVIQVGENELRMIPEYSSTQIVFEETANEFNHHFSYPKLSWRVSSDSRVKAKVRFSYLTAGLQWKTDYTAIVAEDEDTIALNSLVTINNESGKSYSQADLNLIAGDLHKAPDPTPYASPRSGRVMEMSAKMDDLFVENKSFEYHIYQMDNKFDLKNLQKKQLPLFGSATVKATKSYSFNHQKDPENISVFFSIENSKKNNLGIPLPTGRIRISKRDRDQLIFLGEDVIANTPKDETVKIEVGKAFDIKAKRSVLDQRREGKNTEKLRIGVELRNRKDEDIEVYVVEPLFRHRQARIMNSNYQIHRQTADKVEFLIPVKSNQTESLNYEIIYTW